ncbi:lipopolysaccharide biosynthesis protein [Bacillota bacterium Lsc_1132]
MQVLPKISGKKLIQNIGKFSIVTVFSALLSLMVIPLISRVFSVEEFGKINMFITVGNMMMSVALLGMDNAVVRFFHEPLKGTNKKSILFFSLIVGCCINAIITALIFLINPYFISALLFGEVNFVVLIMLSVYVTTLIIFRQLNTMYRMEEKSREYNTQGIAQIMINRVLFVGVALFLPTYFYATLTITLGMVLLMIFYIWKQRELFIGVNPLLPTISIYKLMQYSIPLMPMALIILLNNSIGKLMLSGTGRYDEIGVLAMGISLANIFAILPAGFGVYWSAFMYSNYKTENQLIRNVHNYVILISILMVILIIMTQDILYFLLGGDYRSSQPYFMLLMLGPITALISETTAYGVSIAKKSNLNLIATVVGFIFNLIICYFTIPVYGGLGAAIGVGISSVIIMILRTLIGQHYYRSIERTSKTAIGIIMIITMCIGNLFYFDNILIRMIIIIPIIFISYFIFRYELVYVYKQIFNVVNRIKLRS